MKNFLSNLWSLSRTDRVRTLAIDAVSLPSFCRVNMLKLVSVLVILLTLGVGNAWGAALGAGYTKITNIASLSAGDKVVLYCDDASVGVTGYSGSDATVAASGWTEFTVEKSSTNYYFKSGTKYIKAQTGNKFTIDASTASGNECTVNSSGVLCINSRYLCKNSSYYRMYTSIGSYNPFYVYKVAASCAKKVTITKGTPETGGSFSLDKTGAQDCCDALTVTVSSIVAPSGKKFSAITQSGIASGVTINQSAKTVTYAANTTGSSTINVTYEAKGCSDKGASSITSTSGGNSNTYGPVDDNYKYSTRQILYTKSDLGLSSATKKGTIKSIYFYYKYTTAMSSKTDVKIYMANTYLTSLSTSSYVPYSEFTLVYSGPLNCTATNSWNEFFLDTPFEYTGAGNLVVMIDDDSGVYDGSSYTFYYHSATGAQIYKRSDSSNEDPSTTDWSTYTPENYRPSTKFCILEANMEQYTVNWYVNGTREHYQTDYAGTTLTSIPTPDASDCDGSKVFVGWTESSSYSHASTPPTFVSPTKLPHGGANYYAVFANSASSSKTYQFDITDSDFTSGGYAENNNTKTTTATATDASGATIDVDWVSYQVYKNSGMQWQKNTGYIYNETDLGTVNSVTITKSAGGFNTWYGTTEHPTSGAQGSGKGFFTVKENNTATGKTTLVRVNFTKSATSYSNYATSCCTKLGSVSGTLSSSTPVSATLTWSAVTGAEKYQVKVVGSSSHNNWTDAVSGVTVTGLTCNTAYTAYLRAIDTNGSHCSEGPESTVAIPATSYTVTKTGVTNVTAASSSAIPATTCTSGFGPITIEAASGYVLPAEITVTGASHTWNQASGALTISSVTGNVSITITPTAASCSGQYTFAYGATADGDGKNITDATKLCFEQVGSSNEFQVTGFTIPTTTQYYWVGYNGYFYDGSLGTNNAKSSRNQFKYLPVANLQGSSCGGTGDSYKHAAAGAYGLLRIYRNYSDDNLYVGFSPAGYQMRIGSGDSWTNVQLTQDGSTWTSDLVSLDAATVAKKYYINVWTGSSYSSSDPGVAINNWTDGNSTISSMVFKTGAGDNWDTSSGLSAGMRGKFRTWTDNCANNGYCHFVPYHRVTYNGSGASGSTDPSADVSCEGDAAARTVKAAANGFTVPTGKSFGGWASSPENAAAGTVAYAAGADVVLTQSIVLYAIWTDIDYTVTVNQSPSVGATTTGQTSSAHYNGTINLTVTDIPSGYRFVNWTSSDVTITNPTSATTASFTMPAKNVTVTANFQQTHKVDWYVGGSAPANKIGDDGQTTVVDHGGKIEDFPATTPDGSACDKEFVGWTNTSSYVHGTSPLFTTVEGSPTINANASFYAVFAEVNSVSASLTKMTADDDLEVGDKIVIIAQDTRYGMYQASASSYVSYWTTTDVDGEPSLSEIEADDKKYLDVAAGGATDTWKLGDATNGYLYNSSSTNLEFSTTSSSDLTLIKWTDDSFTLQAGQYISCRTDITGANANKWRGAGASCDPENDNNCSGTEYYYLYKYVPGGTTATGHTINCADCGSSVTVSYSAPGSGNTMTVTKSAAAVASGTVIKTCSAQELTITLTPATHYTADGLTATGVAGVTTSNVGNVYTVTIPAAGTGTLTLTPTFTPETPLSITFIPTVSGATVGSIGTIYSGDNFDFPSVSNLPVGFCADFLGWVDFTNGETFDGDGTRTTAPSELITAGTNSGTMTANKIYKAVYGESETSEVEAYSKVTSSLADWSGNYLIVHEGSARALDGSLGTSNIDAQGNYFSVTISAGKITDDHSTKHWTITKIGETSTYTIKGASGCYIGRATTGNGIDKTTEGASADANTISYSSGVTISGSGGPSLQYYNTSGQERFRYYGSAQQAISLFKLGTTEIITYTYTTAPSCGEKYRVTVDEVTGGSPSVSPKYCADGTTISLVANPSTGYTFTSWTITKDADDSNVTSTLLTGDKQTTANTTFEMPAYDITVTATYTIINYNITYNNLNGATNSNPATYNVASADIDFVDPGARAGYIFKGWYDDAVYTNQVTGIPNGSTGAVTVYAKWAVGYTITWDNAIGSNPASTGVEEGNAIGTLPVPSGSCTFDGTTYSNFVGWYTGTISGVGTAASDAGTEITSADVPTANATYHAVYTNMPDYSGTNTSNVTLPEVATPKENVKVKVDDADDAPEYDGIKIGTSSTKTSSFTFTVPAGTTKITMQGVAWSGKTASVTLSTSVGTISPSTAQSLANSTGASDRSPFTITSNTTLTFNLTNVNSTATITVANSNERVIVWGINASSASGENVGYITQCCDNVMAAPTMNAPTVRTSTAITLSWNTVTNATGYKVSWNGGDWEDVATATTYEKTSLEPGTDYSYKVIAKYTSPYCGASVYEGVVSTKPVYSVTYERGHGTGSCSASGSIPAVAYYEEGAIVSLAASNTFSHPGNTFAAWSSEQVALTAESTTFTMPAENVTVTATWTAKQDKYYDRMHNLTSGEGSYTDGEGKHYIVREGCNYTVPSLTNSTTGDTDCHTTHYVLMGWAAAEHIQQTGENAGQVISGHESYVFTGGGTKTANNNTYYAVWAIVTE